MKGRISHILNFKKRETSKLQIIIYGICSKAPFKHHLTNLYLNLLYMKVILPLEVIYVLCKFDLPNHVIEFQSKFLRTEKHFLLLKITAFSTSLDSSSLSFCFII